jgi:hypothetical protein
MAKMRKTLFTMVLATLIVAVAAGSALAITETSIRLRGMSPDLQFIVYDEYSNIFFNPAYVVHINGTRIYTNLSNYQEPADVDWECGWVDWDDRCPDKFLNDKCTCDGTNTYWDSALLLGGIFQIVNPDIWVGLIYETQQDSWSAFEEVVTDYDYQVDNHWVEYENNVPDQPLTGEYSYDASWVGTMVESWEESYWYNKSEPMAILGWQWGNWDFGLRVHSENVDAGWEEIETFSDSGTLTFDFEGWWETDFTATAAPAQYGYGATYVAGTILIEDTYLLAGVCYESWEWNESDTLWMVGGLYHAPNYDLGLTFSQQNTSWDVNDIWYDNLCEVMFQGTEDWAWFEQGTWYDGTYAGEWIGHYEDFGTLWPVGWPYGFYDCPDLESWWADNFQATHLAGGWDTYSESWNETAFGVHIEYPYTPQWTFKGYGQFMWDSGDYAFEMKEEGIWSRQVDYAWEELGVYSENDMYYQQQYSCLWEEQEQGLWTQEGAWQETWVIEDGTWTSNGFNAMLGAQYAFDPTLGIWLALGTRNHTWKTSGQGYEDTASCTGSWTDSYLYHYEEVCTWEGIPIAPADNGDGSEEACWETMSFEGSGEWDYTCNENITFDYEAEESYNCLIVPVGVEWQPCWIPCVTLRLGATTRIETWDETEVITCTDAPDTLEGTKSFHGECACSWGCEEDGLIEEEECSRTVDHEETLNADGSGVEVWTFAGSDDPEDNFTATIEWDTEGNATETIDYADPELEDETYYWPNYCPVETETTVTTDTWKWSDTDTVTTYSFGATYTPTKNIVIDMMHFSNLTNMQKWVLSVTFFFERSDVQAHD